VSRLIYILPLLVLLGLGALFFVQMEKPGEGGRLPSALIGKPAPMLELKGLEPSPGIGPKDLADGQVKVINFWASWCAPCRVEHTLFARLKGRVALWSINYKDKSEDALGFLDELGDPFERIGVDADGKAGLEWGVYGVPETYVVDGAGKIVWKHVGPLTPEAIRDDILPAVERAKLEQGRR
jgi:cytochrome c biogenesis protein CcmG, thiol:disulfide interchange protein DsbE